MRALALLALLLAATRTFAVTVTATVDPPRLAVGESADLAVAVEGTQSAPTPQITSSTMAGSTSLLRSSSWSMTNAVMSSGRRSISEPLKARPMGVRMVSTITASGMRGSSFWAAAAGGALVGT